MLVVDIRDAEINLSHLVDRAIAGEPFVIARAGKPLVKVTALDAPVPRQVRRIGFMDGQIAVPDDFDTMGDTEIKRLFEKKEKEEG